MADNKLNELIFIKRVKKHPHEAAHGGAWKIAYADFVTAMMAFFLMLWLLSSTTQEQRSAISNYFAPQSASRSTSGAGGILAGRVLDIEGAMTAEHATPRVMLGVPPLPAGAISEEGAEEEGDAAQKAPVPEHELENPAAEAMGTIAAHEQPPDQNQVLGTVDPNDVIDPQQPALARAEETTSKQLLKGEGGAVGVTQRDNNGPLAESGASRAAAAAEDRQFAEIEKALEERIAQDAVLSAYSNNVTVEVTAEGLRIQMIDDDKREMFPLGSAELMDHTQKLFGIVADLVKNQPNRIAISGHTDALPFRTSTGYSNWELSSDRANASRRALMAAGVPENKIARVVGKADSEPMNVTDPEAAMNRRVSIVLLRGASASPPAPRPASAAVPVAPPTEPVAAVSPPAEHPMAEAAHQPVAPPVTETHEPIKEAVTRSQPAEEPAKSEPAAPAMVRSEPEPESEPAAEPAPELDADNTWLRLN